MMSEVEVLTEVPASLKLLVRIIMRCFYGDEHAVVMDKLIHRPCIKEDDLLDLLRFERKQLRAIITTLRNEKVCSIAGPVLLLSWNSLHLRCYCLLSLNQFSGLLLQTGLLSVLLVHSVVVHLSLWF